MSHDFLSGHMTCHMTCSDHTVRSGDGEEGDVRVIDDGPFSLSLPGQVFNDSNSESAGLAGLNLARPVLR